jgi:two-component system chemotaxis response regulator CheY
LNRALRQLADVEVVAVDDAAAAWRALRQASFHLVLVNRVFDADGGQGLALIQALLADAALGDLPVMLVSNYPQHQAAAQAAGARPGIGKAQLGDPAALARLQAVLAPPHD